MKKIVWLLLCLPVLEAPAQQLAPLTVEKIMRDPKWIGTQPSDVFWSPDNNRIYFHWNPTGAVSDSLYVVSREDHHPHKVPHREALIAEAERSGKWNSNHTRVTFVAGHTLYLLDPASDSLRVILRTSANISNPQFSFSDGAIVYRQDDNLYSWNLDQGKLEQLTRFIPGKKPNKDTVPQSDLDRFLESDALHNSAVLREDKDKQEKTRLAEQQNAVREGPKEIYLDTRKISSLSISPDGRFVVYRLVQVPKHVKYTQVPHYVTQSGYVEDLPGRPVVGGPQPRFRTYIYDRKQDTVYPVAVSSIPGIRDLPAYLKDYPKEDSLPGKSPAARAVAILDPIWGPDSLACVDVRSLDFKDRWIMLLDLTKGTLKLLDRQHDDAWIAGPDIGWHFLSDEGIDVAYFYNLSQSTGAYGERYVGWLDAHTLWYQSEKTGYSHLYTVNIDHGQKRALSTGRYEIFQAILSSDKKRFYITSNKKEPAQRQFYWLDIASGAQTPITTKTGAHDVIPSPDGRHLAILYSTVIHPWELYLQDNLPGAVPEQITDRAESAEYRSYPWRVPDIITFQNRDGQAVYASVYRPDTVVPTHPGVIFVHGAGYLQDVGRWWGHYFREHMFMNLLADQGYTVMDIDYRGSAGYGRDWRTAIYRHMGGKDLDDEVDGAKYMADSLGVDSEKIGIWGGSYGGFMTLMALFKTHAFACGAALRSVTDFSHYNHDYTSAILNTPQQDSLAYIRSSPIYFANGLQAPLLMCHGMVDSNVHFQDIVRLTQKLIELGKRNWQLAVFPVESHDFTRASSWTDEYYRVYQLFEHYLK
jgi:dipeptidyl aminopeptidase/acylaminoacyl peptidase